MKLIEYDKEKIKFMPKFNRYEPFFQDSTAMKLLMECRRKYALRIIFGRVPKFSPYQVVLDFGSHYHKFREILNKESYTAAMKHVLSVSLPIPPQGNKFEYLTDLRLIKSCKVASEYKQNEEKGGRIKVIAIEQPFNVSIGDGIFISGRADEIVEWNGHLWGRDFKSTSKDQATFSKGLDPNDQTIRYIVGESLLHGVNIKGIIFEGMYNTKTVGPKIYTVLSSRVKYQTDAWIAEQKINNRILNILREEDIWPMDVFKQNCAWCEYANVCRKTSEEAMAATLASDFDLKPWDSNNVDQSIIE